MDIDKTIVTPLPQINVVNSAETTDSNLPWHKLNIELGERGLKKTNNCSWKKSLVLSSFRTAGPKDKNLQRKKNTLKWFNSPRYWHELTHRQWQSAFQLDTSCYEDRWCFQTRYISPDPRPQRSDLLYWIAWVLCWYRTPPLLGERWDPWGKFELFQSYNIWCLLSHRWQRKYHADLVCTMHYLAALERKMILLEGECRSFQKQETNSI